MLPVEPAVGAGCPPSVPPSAGRLVGARLPSRRLIRNRRFPAAAAIDCGAMSAQSIGEVWHGVLGTQPLPPGTLVAVTGAVALAVVALPRVWRVVRGVVTIAHEGGHAAVALLSGRTLRGIKLHSDTSGVTFSRGRPTGIGAAATSAAGYLTPPALGVLGAALLAAGHITALLWLAVAALAAMLLLVRNAYGVLSVLGTGGLVFAISWFASAHVQAAFAYLFTWFLLIAGVRPVFELQRSRSRGRARDSDADQLARLTGAPGLLWVVLFALAALAALAAGGTLLIT